MHRIFRKALDDATGIAESIIAVMTDVRDFSPFSGRCDSVDVAMFIRRVYVRLIDDYFPFASFYKSTGDGLLLVVPIGRRNLKEVSQEVIANCVKCHAEFGNICSEDLMITFKVPKKIGIGVARGTACCLVSGDTVIDYCGRLLNLTSRLTDLARPSGIVIDGSFNIGLLSDEQKAMLKQENIYLKGVAEYEPIQVYYTPEFTVIPRYNKEPIVSERWREIKKSWSYRELLKLRVPFRFGLPSKPLRPRNIRVIVRHPEIVNGQALPGIQAVYDFDGFEYLLDRGKPVMAIKIPALCRRLKREQLGEDMNITITVAYVEK